MQGEVGAGIYMREQAGISDGYGKEGKYFHRYLWPNPTAHPHLAVSTYLTLKNIDSDYRSAMGGISSQPATTSTLVSMPVWLDTTKSQETDLRRFLSR
jgi:hypothetical protein